MDYVVGNGSSLDERMRVRQPTVCTESPDPGSSLRGNNDRGCYGSGHSLHCDSLNNHQNTVRGMQRLARCLVGGTFDRFHIGHQSLLNSALEVSERVEVWVTNDEMSASKSPILQSFEDRREAIIQWADNRITTHELENKVGPAPVRKDCDSIVCTPETLGNCQKINEMRLRNGLLPLEIIEVPHALDVKGGIVSSSRIRAGLIDTDGTVWLTEDDRETTFLFHKGLDEELKKPSGQLFSGPENSPEVAMSAAMENISPGAIVAVGDVSVATLLEFGVIPDIALVDGMTKRIELEQKVDLSDFSLILSAQNPAGEVTPSLIESIDAALHSDQTTCIEVDGEEDLAPLIVHLLSPLGTNVIYGQPGKGVVLRITDLKAKRQCRKLLSMFEVRS